MVDPTAGTATVSDDAPPASDGSDPPIVIDLDDLPVYDSPDIDELVADDVADDAAEAPPGDIPPLALPQPPQVTSTFTSGPMTFTTYNNGTIKIEVATSGGPTTIVVGNNTATITNGAGVTVTVTLPTPTPK